MPKRCENALSHLGLRSAAAVLPQPGGPACAPRRSTAAISCAQRPSWVRRCRSPGSRGGAAQQAGLVARRVFFDNPDYSNVRVSPDGQHLAYLAPVDGVSNLWVAPVADPAAARPVTRVTDRNIGIYFRWAYTNRHLVFFQERDGDENWRASSVDIANGAIVPLTPEQGVKSFLQEIDRKFPEEMLFRHNAARQEPFRSVPDQRRHRRQRTDVREHRICRPRHRQRFPAAAGDAADRRRHRRNFRAARRTAPGCRSPRCRSAISMPRSSSTSAPTATRFTCSTRADATRRRCLPST